MSTRSPMNKRTQEQMREGKKGGMQRRSAGAAKPARPAAASVHVVPASSKAKRLAAERGESLAGMSKEEKRAHRAAQRRREDRLYAAVNTLCTEDYDYARYNRIKWVLMGIGIAAVVVTAIAMAFYGSTTQDVNGQILQIVTLVISYAFVIGAFVFDMIKIRPIRNKARATAEGLSEGRLNALIERGAAARDAKRNKKAQAEQPAKPVKPSGSVKPGKPGKKGK